MLPLCGIALAGGTSPEERVEVFGDLGVLTGELGLLVGVGAGARRQGFTVAGAAGFGPRTDLFGTDAREAVGLGSLALGWDAALPGGVRVGPAAVLDLAVLDPDEADCERARCRHDWFVGLGPVGLGLQPAVGLRISGSGSSRSGFQTFLGLQPHQFYQVDLPLAPRADLALYGVSSWSFHAWAGRYGAGAGIGRRLSRRPSLQ